MNKTARRHRMITRCALVVLACWIASCATTQPPPYPESTSSTPPKITPFASTVTPKKAFPRIASEGKCAPRYRNGTEGTCVADKPCRGYGVRDDHGQALCECYLTTGGCDAESRCDGPSHGCIPDSTSKDDID